jgi:hypothetical protein
MRETQVTLPELALIAGTRVALGAGLGLLLANRLSEGQRRAAGSALLLVGAVTTVPLVAEVLGGGRLSASAGRGSVARFEADDQLIRQRETAQA